MNRDAFARLHTPGTPLILYNIWDAGSARAVARAGARAVATGSASLAGAQGFEDGEAIGFDALLDTASQIVAAVDLPVSLDMESGFASDLEALARNARSVADLGVVGCNLEDQLIGRAELRTPDDQAQRIRCVADAGIFVNARTDVFLQAMGAGANPNQADLVDQALARARVYLAAGAGSFFVPGLSDPDLIARLVAATDLPVNVMRLEGMASNEELAALGVGRISYGPGPWRAAMKRVEEEARAAFSDSGREQI